MAILFFAIQILLYIFFFRKKTSYRAFLSKMKNPASLSTISLFLGYGFILSFQLLQKQDLSETSRTPSLFTLLFGIILVLLAHYFQTEHFWKKGIKFIKRLENKFGITHLQLVALAASLFWTSVASYSAGYDPQMKYPLIAVFTWVYAIWLAFAGGWQGSLSFKKKITKKTVLITGGLILGAFIVRIINVSHIPIVLSGDEAGSGLKALDILSGDLNNIFGIGWYSFPALHLFFQTLPLFFFGQTTFALRLSSVIVGALTVGAVYLFVKTLFNERTALFSALFLMGLHFHNNFSRIGLNNIWDGLWFVVVLGLLWYGWEKENRNAFLLAGFSLGISQYFYVGVRSLFVIIAIWVFIVGYLNKEKLKRNIPNLALMGFVTAVVFYPLASFFIKYPDQFIAPMQRVSIFGTWMETTTQATGQPAWQLVLNEIKLSFLGFTHNPLRFWYEPGVPILRPWPATLFFVGAASILYKPRDSRTLLIVVWLMISGLLGGLSESAPAAQRYVSAAPALAILVGYGLNIFATSLENIWKNHTHIITAISMLIILLLSADELRFYFYEHIPNSHFSGFNGMVAHHLADYLEEKPSEYEVFFFGTPNMGYESIPSLPFLTPHITGTTIMCPWEAEEESLSDGEYLIFVFLPECEPDLATVKEYYPSGELSIEKDSRYETLYTLYEVSPETEYSK